MQCGAAVWGAGFAPLVTAAAALRGARGERELSTKRMSGGAAAAGCGCATKLSDERDAE